MNRSIAYFLSLLLLLSSCASVSRQQVVFDVLRPAAYTLPTWADSIIVVEAVENPQMSDVTIDATNQLARGLAESGQARMPYTICKAVANEIAKSGYMKVVQHMPHVAQDVFADTVNKLLSGSQNTIVLALTKLNSNSTVGISRVEDEDGDMVDCATLVCATASQFTLVAQGGVSQPLEERNDTLLFVSCGSSLSTIVKGLPQITDRYTEQGQDVGQKTADMLIPVWTRVRRNIYTTNNKNMAAAATWVSKNNWDEARNLWTDTYMNSQTIENRIFSALNIALSYEREDLPEEAALWCSKALDMLETANADTKKEMTSVGKHAQSMFTYLLRRTEQKSLLDKQM